MEKPAATAYPVHELIRRRWSPVGFAPRPIEPEKLASLLEAARWAPSSFNDQPWSFIVAPRQETAHFERLLGCLNEGNVPWAKQAGALLLSVARLTLSRNGNPNRHAWHDTGMATENLVLQAVELGLAAHQMGGFHPGKARVACEIPESYEPLTMIAVGYPAEPADVPAELRARDANPRVRKPLSEMAHLGKFGRELPLPSWK